MATLFKVARHDKPSERKIIRAATIEGLISAAKTKLKLTDGNYKIYTDDFTDIDEDDILLELAHSKESRGEQLILTIVPDDIPWNCSTIEENISKSSVGIHRKISTCSLTSQHTEKNIASSSSSALHPDDELSRIFSKFSTKVQTTLRNGISLDPKDYRSMVHVLSDYLINDVKDTSRGRAQILSKMIVTTYKETFILKIGNKSVTGAAEALRQSVYNATSYQKGQLGKNRKEISSLDESDDESMVKPKAQDEYGCVAYLPGPPPSDELKSLEEKQLKLCEQYDSLDLSITDEIVTFMTECYYLQRKAIHQEKNLSIIFEQWPYFYNYKIIIQHANQLLGKKTDSIWKESLNKLAKPINCWFKYEEIAGEVKDKSKKNQPNEDKRYVRETLKIAKKYSDALKNDEPYQTVIFGFISKFMKEDVKFLYVLIDEEVTNEELIQHVPVSNPVLIIRGQDLHHSQNRYNVVIEKNIILQADSFKDGLLITFLSFYIFGIVYPREI